MRFVRIRINNYKAVKIHKFKNIKCKALMKNLNKNNNYKIKNNNNNNPKLRKSKQKINYQYLIF